MRYVQLALALLVFGSCTDSNTSEDTGNGEVLDWEGEYRTIGGSPQFTVCKTGKTYPVTGDAALIKSVNISYNNFIAQPESPIKMWMRAIPSAVDLHNTGLMDSVLVFRQLLHMTVDQFCPTKASKEAAGRYSSMVNDKVGMGRKIDFDLYKDGRVIMYTDFLDGKEPAEEEGTWGKNSDNVIVLSWPRRGKEMRFSLANGTLTSRMYHAQDVKLILKRVGDTKYPAGRMVGVIDLLKRAAAPYLDTNNLQIEPHTRIVDLVPDSMGLAPVYDQLAARYGVNRAKLTERLMLFENAEDVLN